MCEWLLCEEWCDVYLLCGGRVFSAHRAVLASVSKFLRTLLLSCPVDETPAFIVMPEFDLETMSSALHYIYNGEVMIEKHRLNTFLEIMNALQIFVDIEDLIDEEDLRVQKHISIDYEEDIMMKQNAPIPLVSEVIVTIKKDPRVKTNVCYSDNDNLSKANQESKNCQSINIWTGYLKSIEDRQRQHFPSDSFIERYSLNRNNNGVEGVLEISNERYQEPTSVLLENANDHLSNDLSKSYKMDSNNILKSLYNGSQATKNNNKESTKDVCETGTKINNFNIDTVKEDSVKHQQIYTVNNSLILRHSEHSSMNSDNNLDEPVFSASENKSKQILTRVILNEVLRSPWRPQLPNTFKPFPNKTINSSRPQKSELQLKNIDSNEKNNNNKATKIENNQNNLTNKEMELKKIKRKVSKEVGTRDSSTRYSCTECHKSFSQLRNYKYHMSVHRGTKEFATTCPVCGKFFNDKGYLSSHMKIHRNRKEYKCSLCPKSFNQRVAYNMHVRIHTGLKPHVCEECGKAFSRKMLLKQHQRTHSGERPYACPHCDKRFADRSNMTLHLRLHTGVKPFTCSLCPKSFTKKHHLKSHLNFHTGDKPYSCPRCKVTFTQSSNMRTHLKKCNL